MDSLRKEIEEELKRTRIDKSRIYYAITKLIDQVELGGSGSGSEGPAGPPGPVGPIATPVIAKKEVTPVTEATPAKKVVTKKKVGASA